MTDTVLLRQKINESGYKLGFISEKLNISHQGFLNKINNIREFKASEIKTLSDLLNLTNDEQEAIFFAN